MLERLRERVAQEGADALLVTHPANVRYLSGFTSPEDGRVLVTNEDAVLVTDGRYTVQANEESRLETVIVEKGWPDKVMELTGPRRLAFESHAVSYNLFQKLSEGLEAPPVPTEGFVATLRLHKTPEELAHLREAAQITDEAFEHILGFLRAGLHEFEVALELERFMRAAGAEDKSFEIIVASGSRSAMPHGVASRKTIQKGELVTLDFGAKVAGYHADMTRTVGISQVSDELRELYGVVLAAQEAALAALAPGKSGKEMDGVARDLLAERGLAEHFPHSLGHGVGLEVHEGPRLSKHFEHTLEPGMVVTIEPGVYLPDKGGVRIEDLCVITEEGFERLSNAPKEWTEV